MNTVANKEIERIVTNINNALLGWGKVDITFDDNGYMNVVITNGHNEKTHGLSFTSDSITGEIVYLAVIRTLITEAM